MDILLTEEQKMVRDLCRQIAREKIKPVAAEYDEKEEFPWPIVKIMAEADIFGVYIAEEYGGLGGGVFEMALATEELSWGCGGISLAFAATGLGTFPIILFGNDEQKKKYLTRIAKGTIAAFCITEAEAGSDAGSIKTTAVKAFARAMQILPTQASVIDFWPITLPPRSTTIMCIFVLDLLPLPSILSKDSSVPAAF